VPVRAEKVRAPQALEAQAVRVSESHKTPGMYARGCLGNALCAGVGGWAGCVHERCPDAHEEQVPSREAWKDRQGRGVARRPDDLASVEKGAPLLGVRLQRGPCCHSPYAVLR